MDVTDRTETHCVCVRKMEGEDKTQVNMTVYLYKPNLYRQELCYEGEEDHLLTVPHLLSIDLNPTPQFPPLAAILHKDLWRNESMFTFKAQLSSNI